jgi:hypothetical protein
VKKHPSFAFDMLSPIRYLRLALDMFKTIPDI